MSEIKRAAIPSIVFICHCCSSLELLSGNSLMSIKSWFDPYEFDSTNTFHFSFVMSSGDADIADWISTVPAMYLDIFMKTLLKHYIGIGILCWVVKVLINSC